MTALAIGVLTPDELEALAFHSGAPIELARDHAFLRLAGSLYVAPLTDDLEMVALCASEVCS